MGATRSLAHTDDPAVVLRQRGRDRRLRDPRLEIQRRALVELGVRLLPQPAPAYPERLRALEDAAPLLLVRGEPGVLLGRAVAVVGARAPSAYGLDVAGRLAGALARTGVVVVSGLARGIDAAAHRAALDAGGLTVAFAACGPDRTYPAQHRSLADRIAGRGAVVTEMPLETPPLPQYFPLRNRLIAGLAEVVVVVEGRLRSGSLVTARRALDQGREVMAVPGPIGSPTSEGPNRLLREGAAALTRVEDVFESLGLEPRVAPSSPRPEAAEPPSELAASLLRLLRREPCTRDVLAVRSGASGGQLALALTELELTGRVALDRDGRLRVLGGP